MQFGYTIVYVDDVSATIAAWEAAFGLERKFLHPDGGYGEMETGATTLSFAEREFGRSHFTDEVTRALFDGAPARFEIALITPDVAAAWKRALDNGMTAVVEPTTKPWGQTVGWVRDPEGILIELASPMG
jgi:lactoylglutathione lyase